MTLCEELPEGRSYGHVWTGRTGTIGRRNQGGEMLRSRPSGPLVEACGISR